MSRLTAQKQWGTISVSGPKAVGDKLCPAQKQCGALRVSFHLIYSASCTSCAGSEFLALQDVQLYIKLLDMI